MTLTLMQTYSIYSDTESDFKLLRAKAVAQIEEKKSLTHTMMAEEHIETLFTDDRVKAPSVPL